MRYRTKVDWWLAALVMGLASACLIGGVWLIIQNGDWPLGLGGALAGLAIYSISWPTHYQLADGQLLIRAGVFRWRIPISAIQLIYPSHNPMSAPAWSLKRLRVDYSKPSGRPSFVLISPRDPDLFMRDIAELDAQLEQRADHLARKSSTGPLGGSEGIEP